ncbi:hypothetical protein BDP27DRAFT_1335222 [Rhodocollybia butyracea]|uniref:Adenylate kinase n=1 Tax=Rhodocollybia butyracea TaxID=206335 RepID=A0A9P5PIQ0_9AGAR|nr:hypothetical protein BDP27DRAFT_1335222 [Rhodocollybia butyracea]
MSLNGRRIQVVGHACAGKRAESSFGVVHNWVPLQIPVVHLDSIFWSPDWIKTPVEEARSMVQEYAEKGEWVIDGNQWQPLKDITYPRATDIIWIDPPLLLWLYRLLARTIRQAITKPGSFYKDFVNPKSSIIVQALKLRRKKQKKLEWQRIPDGETFLRSLDKIL